MTLKDIKVEKINTVKRINDIKDIKVEKINTVKRINDIKRH